MIEHLPADAGNPGRFAGARAIFESALERPPADRRQFVHQACGDDHLLLVEVQQMLRADATPHALLDGTALLVGDPWQPGDLFGHFRIGGLVGRGGMGDVYRAHDTTLGRDVALKLLPWADDGSLGIAERLARFQREAQVLAAVNHPNIAAIHGVAEDHGRRALVLELVEGDTLADRIASGPIPIEDAIPIARQVAAGLEAAHELGIVHRDLKPANIALRPDGTAKVLDFGLAKISPPSAPAGAAAAAPTTTPANPTITHAGGVLGTAAYVSPEQARGREADKRSDVWAFGAVVYEMLAGARAFPGGDATGTLANVLHGEVAWSRLPASTPVALRRMLHRCLERDVTQRLRDIGEARIVLESLARGQATSTLDATPPSSVRPPTWRRLAPPVAAAVVAGGLVAATLWPRVPEDGPVTRFVLAMPAGSELLVDPQSRDLAITPDGTQVVYKGGPRIDRTQLFVYRLDQLEPRPLTGAGMPKGPFTSPDGRWIGFFEPRATPGAALKKVAAGGGPALDVASLDGPSRGATWGDDGTIIAASGAPATGLLQIPAAGGPPTILTRPDRQRGEGDHLWPHFLPGGASVLFTITALSGGPAAAQVAIFDRRSGTWRTILRGGSQAHYVSSGHLVYLAGNALWAVVFDPARLEVVGSPTMVVPRVVTLPTGVAEFDIARDGTLVYVARGGASEHPRTLVWVDRQGRETPTGAPPRPYANLRLSPDGTRVAVEIEDQDQDIWVWNLARSTLTRVTTDPGLDETPVWTPDGRRLVFTSQAGGVLGSLFWQAADGSGDAERLVESAFIERATTVLPDASRVVFSRGGDLMTLSLDGSRRDHTLVRRLGGGAGADATVSPDGRWLAYVGGSSGTPQIFASALANPEQGRTQVTSDGGSQPRWAASGRELFFTASDGTLMGVPVTQGATFNAGTATPIAKGPYYSGLGVLSRGGTFDVAPDGRRFLMLKLTGEPGAPPEPPTVVVVKNWLQELQRLVPVRP